ncbi:pfkb domain protein [Arthrobacter sp. Hiyo1]|nr:pfkb domain protein [Arthrobacter sp. Hiyo1]
MDIVFAGLEEAELAVGTVSDAEEAARRIAAMGPGQVIIKLGADGALAFIDGQLFRQEAMEIDVLDTVGAATRSWPDTSPNSSKAWGLGSVFRQPSEPVHLCVSCPATGRGSPGAMNCDSSATLNRSVDEHLLCRAYAAGAYAAAPSLKRWEARSGPPRRTVTFPPFGTITPRGTNVHVPGKGGLDCTGSVGSKNAR